VGIPKRGSRSINGRGNSVRLINGGQPNSITKTPGFVKRGGGWQVFAKNPVGSTHPGGDLVGQGEKPPGSVTGL